jgi:hypothetical protein
MMLFNEFCSRLAQGRQRSSVEKALALLWWTDHETHGSVKTASELSRMISQARLGNPNSSLLNKALRKSVHTQSVDGGFGLRASSRAAIAADLDDVLDGAPAVVVVRDAFIPDALSAGTRGYIERVALQANGCYAAGYFDAASVMVRRLVETLIIEAYEHLARDSEIRGGDGHYLMLGDLASRATGQQGLNLGRDAKRALADVKALGDKAAHNRRFNAVRDDLVRIRDGVRCAIDELINLAALRRSQTTRA